MFQWRPEFYCLKRHGKGVGLADDRGSSPTVKEGSYFKGACINLCEPSLTVGLLPRVRLFSTDAEFGGGKRLLVGIALNPADNRVYTWGVFEKLNRRSKCAA